MTPHRLIFQVQNVKINILKCVDTLYGQEARLIKRGLTTDVIEWFAGETNEDINFYIEDIKIKIQTN